MAAEAEAVVPRASADLETPLPRAHHRETTEWDLGHLPDQCHSRAVEVEVPALTALRHQAFLIPETAETGWHQPSAVPS